MTRMSVTTPLTSHPCRAILVRMLKAQRVSGHKIRQARLARGWSQAQLARAAKTSERNIVRWENSQNSPRLESVFAIAAATGRPLAYFLVDGDADDEESEDLSTALHAAAHAFNRLAEKVAKNEVAA